MLHLGPLGDVSVAGSYSATDAFKFCGAATGSWAPFEKNNLGFKSLTKFKISQPGLCVRRPKAGAPIELEFDGSLSAGGAGLHLIGQMYTTAAGLQFKVYAKAKGAWNLKDLDSWLDSNTLSRQIALVNTELIITTERIVDPVWRELAPGIHLKGAISLTPEAQAASTLARSVAGAKAILPKDAATANSVPMHLTVTSGRFDLEMGIPGNLQLKPPFGLAGTPSWNVGITTGTAASIDVGATVPITYKFASQPEPTAFIGRLTFRSPTTFQGAFTVKGGMVFKNVTLDHLAMQMGLDITTFPATLLPSALGMSAQVHWAGASWELAAAFGLTPADILFHANLEQASVETLLGKLPVPAKITASVPKFVKDLAVRKSELYFAPANMQLGDRYYRQGVGFTGDIDSTFGSKASVSLYWEDTGVRFRAKWLGFDNAQLSAQIMELAHLDKLGITEADAKTLLDGYGIDSIVMEAALPVNGTLPSAHTTWVARFAGKPLSGSLSASGASMMDMVKDVLSKLAKDWYEKKKAGYFVH